MSIVVIEIVYLVREQNALRQEYFNEVNGKRESDAPVKEVHDVSFRLYHLFPHWHDFGVLSSLQVSLNIIDEDKLVIYFIKFGGYQEASAKEHRECLGRGVLLGSGAQKVSIKKLNRYVDGLLPLSKFLSKREDSLDEVVSLLQINSSSRSVLLRVLECVAPLYLLGEEGVQLECWRFICVEILMKVLYWLCHLYESSTEIR